MPRLARALLLAVLSVAAPACADDAPRGAVAGPPNVVVVFTDDQGWGDVGVQGAVGFETPNLDRLAADGVRFTDAYVTQAVCSASRAGLLTGCYPNRIGIHGALGPASDFGIHHGETTLAELCRRKGHATAIYGKWHLGHHPEFLPTRHGFDAWYGIPYSNDMWPHHPESPKAWPPLPLFEGEEVVALNPDQSRFTGEFTRRAVDFIERAADAGRPFFVYVAHPMPHVPLYRSEAFAGSSAQGTYGDVIQEIDASVGALLDAVERVGQDDNTLFLFASDNGPWLSYGDHAGSPGPFREGKGTCFEGGVRVPFLARWPGHIPPGTVCDEPVMTIDVYPTIARVLDLSLDVDGQRPVDGRDIWPLMTGAPGATSPHEALFFYYKRNDLEALRAGRWKLHFPHGYRSMVGREPGSGGVPGRYDYGVSTGLELYDLEEDPAESTDVSAEHPDVMARLQALADDMRADLGDALTDVAGTGRRAPGRVGGDAAGR